MVYFSIKGKIIHIYDIISRYSKINESQYFQKQNIIVQCETELYTICFVDKKIELLKDCVIGSEVELDIKVKGRMWKYKETINSVNELNCLKLKLNNKQKIVHLILHENSFYNLVEYYYQENIMLKLDCCDKQDEINLTAVCDFMHESEKSNHILFSNHSNGDIFKLLQEQKIIEHVYDIHQNGAASGYVCKLLYKEREKESSDIFEEKYQKSEEYDHEIDFSNYNDEFDPDQQSDEFWNQF